MFDKYFKSSDTTIKQQQISPVTKGGITIIAVNSHIIGNFDLNNNLHIDGKIEGTIKSSHCISIGKSGFFKGEICAPRIMISGKCEGEIKCNQIDILDTGNMKGNIVHGALVIEKNGLFIGEKFNNE